MLSGAYRKHGDIDQMNQRMMSHEWGQYNVYGALKGRRGIHEPELHTPKMEPSVVADECRLVHLRLV